MKTTGIWCVLFTLLVFHACKKPAADFNSNPEFYTEYISAFTAGLVPTSSDIRVVLAKDHPDWRKGQELDAALFDISPSLSGKVVALSTNTVAFIPKERLKPDTEYQVAFRLGKVAKTPEDLAEFRFTVKTIKQDFAVETLDFQSQGPDFHSLGAVLRSADVLQPEEASKLVTARHLDKSLPIVFEKAKAGTEFRFRIDSIPLQPAASTLYINEDGKPSGIDRQHVREVAVAARNDFRILDVRMDKDNNQLVLINFSQPLLKVQDFNGLVSIRNANSLRFSVQGNLLKVFFSNRIPTETVTTTEPSADSTAVSDSALVAYIAPSAGEDVGISGAIRVDVFAGIESEYGLKLRGNATADISLEQIKPNVRLVKSGTILPSSENLRVNFEAVNLAKVDVKVFKIYKNNILQFLHDNELNGSSNLARVGQPVAKKTLDLKENPLVNTSRWNTFGLDLAKLIQPDPGAIYRVEFSFKKDYSLYDCEGNEASGDDEEYYDEDYGRPDEDQEEDDVNYSNYYGDYYYDNYEWRQRQNPCGRSYYYNTRIATNILATNLGVIVKRGENKSYLVAVADLLTTQPVSGAQVELYSYQQQKIASGTTNSEGITTFKSSKFAYFAIVTQGGHSTYLKLDDGLSLSVSNFDVAGEQLQKGLKGYLYSERGVWRPGDRMWLSFILDDAANRIPEGHPVKFRLSDPQGKVVYQTVRKSNKTNHYVFPVDTDANAPTGNWEAMVSVGGARFYKNVKIETIKPNRLRIRNGFAETLFTASKPNRLNLNVSWLHGAVARNLKVDVQAKFTQQTTAFPRFPLYQFDDLVRRFNTEELSIFNGKLDEKGNVSVPVNPKLQGQAPGMLRAAFITKVYEEGGDFSSDVLTATYSPFNTYVGIKAPAPNRYGMLETGKQNRFDLVTVDANGNPKAVSGLEVKVFKTEWNWWWQQSGEQADYSSATSTQLVRSFTVSTGADGKANVTFALGEEQWGRYLIRAVDPQGGHATATAVTIDWPSWSSRSRNDFATNASMLMLSTDKKEYAVGEKIQLTFPSSEGGRALISFENGSRVTGTMWAETKKGETRVTIPVRPDMAPNVYLHVTLLQPHAHTKNDSPIRMYGIVPVSVVDKNTILKPVISMPDALRPEQSFTLKVSEATGKRMTYTVAIVDDGLLDLTRFKTPNAWDHFYVKEALGVRTWDIYDEVIGAYGGKISQIFSIGGDQDLSGGKAKKANRFKPVVVHLGPFELPKGGKASHTIKLPKYIGSVRAMVVAANTETSAYGMAEKTVAVKSPLMVLGTLPRKISPSEKAVVPVTVFAMEKEVKNVKVTLAATGGLKVLGTATQTVAFTNPDEKQVYFNLAAGTGTGISKIAITAVSGKHRSTYEVELDVVNPNPVTSTYAHTILAAGSKALSWTPFGVAGSNTAKIEIASIPSMNLNGRLDYLLQYPHGCVEQTTSAVFPQLYLTDVADVDAHRKTKIQQNVMAGIRRIAGFQLPSGGFTYWPGSGHEDEWGTSYAGHFLIEAEKKGYVIPAGFKSKWVAYQKKEAKAWRFQPQYGNDIAQAYRLYTLAVSGSADLASMNRLRETKGISNEAKLRLAATYAVAGQKGAGQSLLALTPIDETGGRHWYYYGSADRNRAMALETLLLLGQKQKAFSMAKKLAASMSSDTYMSTQTTAYSLLAMARFARENGGKGIDVVLTVDGKQQIIQSNKAVVTRGLSVKPGTNSVSIRNRKGNTLFVTVQNSGVLPIGKEQVVQKNISASVAYVDAKGQPVNVGNVRQGTEFTAVITLKNLTNERVDNVALTQILPSGFEIVNTRFTDYGEATQNTADYIDIRDDRTNFYFPMKAGETKLLRVKLNASYLGVYYLPGLQCEAMYDASYQARTKGQWVQIVR